MVSLVRVDDPPAPAAEGGDAPTDPLVDFETPFEPMPASISEVIRAMDRLTQGRYQYYRRQRDNRGECAKMRSKLRTYARKHEDELGVAHWVETRKWKPPNDEALSALMVLMRSMIDRTWPMEESL